MTFGNRCGGKPSCHSRIDILPVPTDEAARQLQSTLLGVETNVANWQRRQNANNNFTATVPYDMELQRKETKEMLDDLTTRDQRMMFGLVTLVHLADNKEQLDSDTETLYSTARKHLCQLSTLRWQQKDGLDTVLPYGLRKIQALRTLTTESTAVLIPFRAQEIMQPNGLYYGQNAVSKNMIVADMGLKNEACRASRSVALNNLALYHELMEENPEALNCLKDAVIE